MTLLSGLDKGEFNPVVICPEDSGVYGSLKSSGYTMIPLAMAGEIQPARDLKTVLNLRQILGGLKPDILHIHGMKAGFVGRFAVAPIQPRPRVILTLHSFLFDERTSWRKRAFTSRVERRLSQYTNRYVAVSKALRDHMISDICVPSEKTQVIYNGIKFADPKTKRTKPCERVPVIGTVARLAPQKGVEYFIRAAAILLRDFPTARFRVVGDGPFRQNLEALAMKMEISESVEFAGFRHDVGDVLSGFDVFVLPSTHEAFGITLLEAMSRDVPVVASKTGGIPEIVDGLTTGLLAEPANPEQIADRVRELLLNPNRAAALAHQGNLFVRENFTADRMVAETEQMYSELCDS